MTVFFVSRHPGALEWLGRQGLAVDQRVEHLDVSRIDPGDTVVGTLPVNLAAQVCAAGARYLHLSLALTPELRGQELSAEDLEALGASLEVYEVRRLSSMD
jgi:CRISPR-associated protein Csx16